MNKLKLIIAILILSSCSKVSECVCHIPGSKIAPGPGGTSYSEKYVTTDKGESCESYSPYCKEV